MPEKGSEANACARAEGRKAMASLGSCKKLIASGSQMCAGIFEIDGEGVDREKLQEMTEGRERGTRSSPLECPMKEFHQS